MNIIQTKLRKELVETPELRTNNIKYLGQDMPLYDVVTSQFIPNPTEFENEFSITSSYDNSLLQGIRMLTHTPVYHNTGLLMLREISLFTHDRPSNNLVSDGEVIALCVYYRNNNDYVYIGCSSNPYANPNTADQITFTFDDLKLYQITANNEVIPYSEVYIKPIRVYLEDFNYNGVENTAWDDNVDSTDLMLKGCSITNLDYNPYVTSLDGSFSPHMIFKYKTGSFSIDNKIPHNMNGNVHLTPEEKRQVEAVCNMSNLIFDDTSIKPTREVVDTRKIDSTYAKTNLEIMCGFEIRPADYVGKNIAKVTIRRGTNKRIDDNIRPKLINNKYLQADCFGADGNRIRTHFSLNQNSQSENDGGFVDFRFQSFEVLQEYAKIEFRLSESNINRQDTTYLSFVGGSLRNNQSNDNASKLLVHDGWVLKWLTNAPLSGQNPVTQNNMSPDFTIVFEQYTSISGTNIIKHIADTNIHVSEDDREKLDNLSDLTTRVSNIETSIGDNGSISQNLEEITQALNSHTSTQVKHVSIGDRKKWDEKVDYKTFDERFGELQKLFDTTPKEKIRNTKDIFAKDGTGSAARIHAWDMKTADYVGEYLTQVTIYRPTDIAYIEDSDILHNNPQWLSVECFDADGNLLDTYFSTDKDSQKDGEDNTTTWNFDEIKIKEEYNKLRFRVTTQEDVLENQPQSMKRAILCYTYTNIPDTNDWGLIEQNNVVQAGHTMYFQFKTITKQYGILEHVDNKDIHVTLEDKERWDNIVSSGTPNQRTYTEGNNIDISDDNVISVVTTDVIKNSNEIPTSKAVFNEIYDTQVFKNWDRTKHTTGQDSVGTIVFGRKHFISGIVSKITIPHDNKTGDGAGENGYLAIQVFDEKLDENNQSVLEQVAIYYSTEEEQYNTTKGKYEFLFNNVEIPENYKQVHLSVVENKTIVPSPTSSGNRQIRICCLAKYDDKNETVVYEEDDECYVNWKTNTDGTSAGGANYVAVIEVECKKPCYDVVHEKIEKITDYKSNISSTVYATTNFLPSGTVEQEDSVQKIQILLNNDVKTGFSKTNKLTNVSIHRHATGGNYNTMYYLQIRAWDKTTNELYKFTSIDKHAQSESKVVSWYFDDAYFGENLKDVIVIGFVSTKDASDFVGGTPLRVGTWNINGSRWYLNEWAVSWNNAWQNRTPHVSLEFETSDSSINHKLLNLMDIITSLQEKVQILQEQVNSLKETT